MKSNSTFALILLSAAAYAQTHAALPPLPAPLAVPKPGPMTDAPYAPTSILPGGVVVTLFPAGSPYLKADKIREPEQYSMSQAAPGRVSSIVNIHNPSIEVHTVDRGINTGAAVILAAGGGHNTLNVGSEAADFVPYFYNYGVNTIILRNRLRRDGYNPQTDEVYDAQQAIRVVRAYAKEWNIDPNKIGIMGFSAGAELAAPAAVLFEDFDKKNSDPSDPFAGISSRPDFVGLVYPGPTPFARGRTAPPIPRNTPPAFIVCAGSDDLMQAVLDRTAERGAPGVRLLQSAFHNRSLSLYTKLGFDTREPISVMTGPPLRLAVEGCKVRAAQPSDIPGCDRLCLTVHGHARSGELADAVKQGAAFVIERDGCITGYTTGLNYFGHSVAESNRDLQALVGAAENLVGPGFLVPTRNGTLFRWCLEHGLRVVQPNTLMSMGLYNEPSGAWFPSILY